MTSYNVAVTVSPNIFRSRNNRSEDIMNHAVYYGAMITMIDRYDDIFDEASEHQGVLNHGGVGTFQPGEAVGQSWEQEDDDDESEGDLLEEM